MFIIPVPRDHRETRQLSHLIHGSFDRFFQAASGSAAAPRSPALDVAESDRAYTVKLDVPGVAKEDVKVSIDGRRVTVRTQQQADKPAATRDVPADAAAAQIGEPTAAQTAVNADTDRIVYRERAAASYARSFTLPVEVEQAEADAKLEHGVLTLTLPKRNARVAAQLTVN